MKFFALLILSPAFAWSQTSYVPATYLLKKGGLQTGLAVDYFKTSKTVDKDGERASLSEGQSFTRTQAEFSAQYGVTSEFQLGGGARLRRNQAEFTDNNGEDHSEASSGIQSTFVNFGFAFPKVERMQYTVEGLYRYVPYTNEDHSLAQPGQLVLGDDGSEYYAGLGATYASPGNNYLTVRSGYRRPGKDLSAEVYWQIEAALAWSHLALIGGVDGNSSLKNDPYESDAASRPVRNTGGSSLYNSTNREWLTPYVGLNLALGKLWRVELRASQVVAGNSTDLGTGFGINLIRRVDKVETRVADKKFKTYDIEAAVTKVSPKKEYVVIDKGLTSDVEKGMRFDFFENDYLGGNVLVAQGTVVQVKSDTAIVRMTQKFSSKTELKIGLIGRASLK